METCYLMNNMKKIATYFFVLMSTFQLLGQETRFGFETGIGNYQMTELKSIMANSISENPLQPQIVTNFPAYFIFSPSITFCQRESNWGINFTLFSTGARASIRDYSGEYRYDNEIVGYAPALFKEFKIHENKKLSLFIRADLGMMYSRLNLSEIFVVNDVEYFNESDEAMSLNFFIKPCLKSSYRINNKVSLDINAGYHFDFWRGGLCEPTDLKTYFKYVKDNGTKLQWNGIRIGLGCTYAL